MVMKIKQIGQNLYKKYYALSESDWLTLCIAAVVMCGIVAAKIIMEL